MREALAILGAVLAIVALTISVVTFRQNFGQETDTATLENRLVNSEGKLERLDTQVGDAQKLARELEEKLGGLEHKMLADPGELARRNQDKELDRIVGEVVQDAMNKRLQAAGVPSAAPPPAPSPADKHKASFDAMVASAVKHLSAAPPLDRRVSAAFESARADLNFFAVELSTGNLPRDQFDKHASDVRSALDARLKKLLGDEAFKKFDEWKKKADDPYIKRFLGLQ
ncbi:MAG: hypothetical protein JW909_07610 [Planctomycetes bacterium]|nr:hypothetical protein [Planctomycetota bacterium]